MEWVSVDVVIGDAVEEVLGFGGFDEFLLVWVGFVEEEPVGGGAFVELEGDAT